MHIAQWAVGTIFILHIEEFSECVLYCTKHMYIITNRVVAYFSLTRRGGGGYGGASGPGEKKSIAYLQN